MTVGALFIAGAAAGTDTRELFSGLFIDVDRRRCACLRPIRPNTKLLCGICSQCRYRRYACEIIVKVQKGYVLADRDGGDQTVDELADGSALAATDSIDSRSRVKVDRLRR